MLESVDDIAAKLNRITMNPSSNNMETQTRANTLTSGSSALTDRQRNEITRMITNLLAGRDETFDDGSDIPVGTVSSRLEELDKVPDIVKSLREFSGKPGEFSSWRKSVERVIDLYSSLRGTGKYYAILHTIRTKIIGEADTALESYRTPLDWAKIRKCLMVHYADKRDIGTLEYQMNVLCQGHRGVTEFYQDVYQTLSLILDKVSCLELDDGSLRAMTNTYREKALDTFIRGLNGDLPRLLSVKGPTSLPEALHLCLKLDNMAFRRDYAQKGGHRQEPLRMSTGSKFYPELANIPTHRPRVSPAFPFPNNLNMQNQRPQFGGQPFAHRPQQFFQRNQMGGHQITRPYTGTQNFPQNQFRQFPSQFYNNQSKPEPMDIDRSIQVRPQQNQNFKRPAQFSVQTPMNKIQRNFHVNVDNQYPDIENQSPNIDDYRDNSDYQPVDENDTGNYGQQDIIPDDYQERNPDDIPANFIDMNFLD